MASNTLYTNEADERVANLPDSGLLNGSELFYADNGAADVSVTADQIKAFAKAGLAAGDISGLAAVATSGAIADVSGTGPFATGTDAANLTGTINNARLNAIPNTALANSGVTVNTHALALGGALVLTPADIGATKADVGLGNVTNDVQTKAAVVPNTAPAAGQVLVGNAGGTAYAPATVSGDAALSSAGALTVTKTNGTAFGTAATKNVGTAANNVVQLDASARLPAVDGSLLTGIAATGGSWWGAELSYVSSTSFGVSIGVTPYADKSGSIALTSAFTKATGAWAAGTGNGALDTGTIAANTWYYCFAIKKSSDGTKDILLSASLSSPLMPTGFDKTSYLGSIKTDAGAAIIPWVQTGNKFSWGTPYTEASAVNPSGTTAVTLSFGGVPTGMRVEAFGWHALNVTSNTGARISDLSTADVNPNATLNQTVFSSAGAAVAGAPFSVFTNNSAQVRFRTSTSGASTFYYIATNGWIDNRGRI